MTEPTDAEIVAVMRDGYNCRYNDEADHTDFARAVLARWGQPTPPAVVEPLTEDAIAAWIHQACRHGRYPVICGNVPFRAELWPMLIEFARDHGIGIKKENGNV